MKGWQTPGSADIQLLERLFTVFFKEATSLKLQYVLKFGHVKHCLGTRKRLLLWQTESLPEFHDLALEKPQPLSVLQAEEQQQELVSGGSQNLKQCWPTLFPVAKPRDYSAPYLYKQLISMLHAKKVKQEGLLHSIWLQHNFAIPEMLERRGRVPTLPITLHTLSCPAPFWGSGEQVVNWLAPSAERVTTPKVGILDNLNSAWHPMQPSQVTSTWQFQIPDTDPSLLSRSPASPSLQCYPRNAGGLNWRMLN